MNLPNEILNKIFMYIKSPTAQLIENEYTEYLTTYDEEYNQFYFSFSDNYFCMYNSNHKRTMSEFCRCHMINYQYHNQNKCLLCLTNYYN